MNGWKCPGCGNVWAPHVEQCRRCATEQTQPSMPAFGPPVGDLWDKYRKWGEKNLAGWTAVKAPAWRCHLGPAFASWPWQEVTPTALDAYIHRRLEEPVRGTHGGKRLVSPATVNNEITTLKALFSWCVKRRLIQENPIAGYVEMRTEDNRDFFVPEADLLELLRHASPVARWFLVLAFETGMRRDEIRLLEPHEIDWQARVIRLPAHRTKSRKAREVPLSDLALEVLRDAFDRFELARRLAVGFQMRWIFFSDRTPARAASKTAVWNWLVKARKAAGVKGPRGQNVWWHSLRKSFASILAGEGHAKSIYVLMDIMGHTSKEAHDRYTRMTPSHRDMLREAMSSRRSDPGATSAAAILKLVRNDEPPTRR